MADSSNSRVGMGRLSARVDIMSDVEKQMDRTNDVNVKGGVHCNRREIE